MKLYDLVGKYNDLLTQDLDNDVIKDTLEGLEGDIEDKADNIACVIKELVADVEAIKNEEKRLNERRKSKDAKIFWLKKYLLDNLKAIDSKGFETSRNKISVRLNPPKLILDESKIGTEYIKTQMVESIDKDKIKKDLQDGKTVSGAKITQDERVDIK